MSPLFLALALVALLGGCALPGSTFAPTIKINTVTLSVDKVKL
jgi:hypothetical protein